MNKYIVKIKYGKIGKPKNTTQTIHVKAESDMMASILAINKFKNSNISYKDMEADAIEIKKV
jgi:hypothetical protein